VGLAGRGRGGDLHLPTGATEAIDMAKSILLDCATSVEPTVTVATTAITPENAKQMMGN
jgi:ribose transport system substrate-binding protein